MIKELIGFVGMVGVGLWTMDFDVSIFANVPSLIIVLGLTFFALVASGCKIILPLSLLTGKNLSRNELHEASVTIFMAGRYSFSAGIVGVLIGMVLILGNLDDPAAIGPALAICLLTALYGTILKYFVYAPLVHSIDKKITDYHSESEEE